LVAISFSEFSDLDTQTRQLCLDSLFFNVFEL
jgi:hypothetical protein